MAQAVQTRCRGCGEFIAARPDTDDWAAEERAYFADRYQEHDCEAEYSGYSVAPRPGEELAYLASLGHLDEVEELEPAALAPSVAQVARTITIREEPSSGQPVSAVRMRPQTTRRADASVPAMRMVRPSAPICDACEQLTLAGSVGPGRQRRPVRPLPYLPGAPAGRRDAARPGRRRPEGLSVVGVGWDRDAASPSSGGLSDEVVAVRPAVCGSVRVRGDRADRSRRGRGRGPCRLSRLLRWFQDDDPRLTRVLERPARVVEWIERQFVGDQ